jgi:hypothetical protein
MSKTPLPSALGIAFLGAFVAAGQHAHINAGVNAASTLVFANADRFAAESGFVVRLPAVTNGIYGGYHIANSPTFTALASTPINGGPATGHALPGTRVVARIVEVDGPVGGEFGFWESPGDEMDAEALTFSVPVGERAGTREFPLSENSGQPGADPYGHVHGRYFSATLPGLYTVGLRLRDASSNGPDGGPLHPESAVTRFLFQAGDTISKAVPGIEGLELTFAAASGRTYQVEFTDSLESPNWTAIGTPVSGLNRMATVTVPTPVTRAFFRIRIQ